MMSFFRNKQLIIEILILLLLSLIPLLWFSPEHMFYGSDSGYPLNFISYFIQRTFTWSSSQSFGVDMSTFTGGLPLHGIQYIISTAGVEYFSIQKVTLVFWFAAVSFSMYICVRHFFSQPSQWVIRIGAVLLYAINFYIFLFWNIGSQTTLSAYAFLPICFLILFRFINKELSPIRAAVYLNFSYLLLNAGGVTGLPLLGPAIVVAIGTLLYQLLFSATRQYLLRAAVFLFFSFILFLVLNAYFLFPFLASFVDQFNSFVSKGGGIEGAISWTIFTSKFDSYSNLFRLQGDNIWYIYNLSYPYSYLTNPFLVILSFSFAILAYLNLGIAYDKKIKKLVMLLVGLSLIGVFLSAGTHDPLGGVYTFLMERLPGFAAFRSAYYKFMPLIIFSFAILDGMAIYYISKKIRPILGLLLSIVFIAFLLVYHSPFFKSENFLSNNKYSTVIKVPDYVREFSKEKLPPDTKYRTLILPPLSRGNQQEIYKWQYYSGYPIFPGLSDKSFVENNAYLNSNEKTLVENLFTSIREDRYVAFLNAASSLSIKYILVTSDVDSGNIEAFRELPAFYINKLDNKNFKLIWERGEWRLYEIYSNSIKPPIYTFNSAFLYNGDIDGLPSVIGNREFVEESNLPSNASRKISLSGSVIKYNCVSCDYPKKEELKIVIAKILPNSFFYPVKVSLENNALRKITDHRFLVSEYLGLSWKRVSEMKVMHDTKGTIEEKNWLTDLDLLFDNWRNINSLLLESGDIQDPAVLNKVINYSRAEITNLKQIYRYETTFVSVKIKDAIKEATIEITSAQNNVPPLVPPIDNLQGFSYEIKNVPERDSYSLMVDAGSLIKDNFGNPIYPVEAKTDHGDVLNIEVLSDSGEVKLLGDTKYAGHLYLYFPNQKPQFTGLISGQLNFFEKTEKCLSSEITDYKWYEKYKITASIGGSFNRVSFYKKTRNIYDKAKDNTYFDPTDAEDIGHDNPSFIYDIEGQEGDKSPVVYFCTDTGSSPEKVFRDITARIVYKPVVFLKKDTERRLSSSAKVSYKKVNPTLYSISAESKSPFYIGFTDRYSDAWKLIDTSNGREIGESTHLTLNGYANAWYIDQGGSYNMKLVFVRQNDFKIGLIVTISSILFTILTIVIYLVRKHSRRNE